MSLRTLLVHADTDEQLMNRVTLAAGLARAHDAKLIVAFPLQAPLDVTFYSEYVAVETIQALIGAEQQRAADVRAKVADRLAGEGISWQWRTCDGGAQNTLPRIGAVADVIVMGQGAVDTHASLVAAVALTAGRPVLCMPNGARFESCGKRILLAWNGSRESARAAHDVLPFLKGADQVVVFTAGRITGHDASVADIAAYFAAHGTRIEVRHAMLAEVDTGTGILQAAAESDADMIAMGAYGHSRLREWVFGGTTRTILTAMTIPVLLSH
ncbi:universal stress protein [Vineibacter terrae]|nr:universal stress protein [Vineibacter terrae]